MQPTDGDGQQSPTQEKGQRFLNDSAGLLRERFFFYTLVVVLTILTTILVWPFISAILLAIIVVIIAKPLYDWLLARKWVKGRTNWATTLTIVSSLLLVAIPLLIFLGLAIHQANTFSQQYLSASRATFAGITSSLRDFIHSMEAGNPPSVGELNLQQGVQKAIDVVSVWLSDLLNFFGESLPRFIINAMIVLVIVMVALPRYEQPDESVFAAVIPFPEPITQLYIDKIKLMIIAMFRGTFVIAIVQGAIMGVAFWIAGVPSAMFLGLVSMFLSLLPVIGVALVAWPVAILLFLAGNVWQAIFIIAMLILVVGNVDTVMRPMLVPEGAYLNPALVLLSVFGGLKLMGIVGAFYGPVIMILLVTSIDVYTKYILRSDLEPYLDEEGALDLEKLGLQSKEASDETKSSGILSAANKFVSRILARSDEPDQESSSSEAA